ncbi:putative Major Facilitator Superfamily [Leishmania utingensis]|uniref:Major Facilitator Superfamily n=2 Tax=Viannia TaxID=37616 RepID=A0AAW3CC91_9TRYP
MSSNGKNSHRRYAESGVQQPSTSAKPTKTPSNTVLAFAQWEEENHVDDAALVAAMDDENADPLLHPAHTRALSHIEQREENRLRGDPWRFAVTPIFCLLSISNAMQWIAFAPIVDEVRTYFNMNATQVNFLATTYVIAYVVIVFLSCKLYEVTGIKMGVLIAAAANALGALLKIIALYVWPNAVLLYLAQVFNSFTEVLTIATPPLISNRWFPENERMVANTVMSSSLNFGCGIGVLIPTFFVGPTKQSKNHFGNFFWFHFTYAALVLVLVIFLFPKKPRYAASHVAARQQNCEERRLRALNHVLHDPHSDEDEELDHQTRPHPKEKRTSSENQPLAVGVADVCEEDNCDPAGVKKSSVAAATTGNQCSSSRGTAVAHVTDEMQDAESENEEEVPEVQPVNVFSVLMDCFRECRSNWSFILLAISSAAELGLIWGVATVLPQMLAPYGISEAISGWIGFLNLVLGTVVCPFFMPLVDRYGRRYKLLLCALSVVVVVVMVLLTLLLHFGPAVHEDGKYYVVVVFVLWGGIAGMCQNFMMPLMFEYVVELTFPMAESTSAPVLTWSACLTNFLLTLIFGEVLTDTPTENKALRTFIGASVVSVIGCVTLLLTKPLTKRTDYEKHQVEALEQRKRRLQSAAAAVADIDEAGLTCNPGGAAVDMSASQSQLQTRNSAHSHQDRDATKRKMD